jgi:polar amino acid transport system substrate-binding protein
MFLVLALAGSVSLALPAWPAEPLKLVTNTWSPYVDKNLPGQGLAIELVMHILRHAGYEPTLTIETWPRAMEGAKIGVYDAIAAAWVTEERERDYLYSLPYLNNWLRVVGMKSRPLDQRTLNELAGFRLGIVTDYAYGVDFDAIEGVQLVRENHLIQNLLNLSNGRVDFVVGDERAIRSEINAYLPDRRAEFGFLEIELPVRSLYLAVSRQSPIAEALVKRFNDALVATRNDGSYERILAEWDDRLRLGEGAGTPVIMGQ